MKTGISFALVLMIGCLTLTPAVCLAQTGAGTKRRICRAGR